MFILWYLRFFELGYFGSYLVNISEFCFFEELDVSLIVNGVVITRWIRFEFLYCVFLERGSVLVDKVVFSDGDGNGVGVFIVF